MKNRAIITAGHIKDFPILERDVFKRLGLLLAVSIGALCFFAGQVCQADPLFIVEKDSLYGFADVTGKVMIEPQYQDAEPFTEGLAAVKTPTGWGFIDKNNAVVVPFGYIRAWPFSDGLAAIEINDKIGYINTSGQTAIKAKYAGAQPFSGGLAAVLEDKDKLWLFINKEGTPVPGLSGYEDARSFPVGDPSDRIEAAQAPVKIAGKWHFIDRKGQSRIRNEFEDALPFSEGLAAVKSENGGYGYITNSGEYAISPSFDSARPFSEELAAVKVGPYWGFINHGNSKQIQPTFPLYAKAFIGGLALVSDRVDGASMYVNREGHPQFYKSRQADQKREIDDPDISYKMTTLGVQSVPSGAQVYLVPRYDWEFTKKNTTRIKDLQADELKTYVLNTIDFSKGTTDETIRVIEQNYVGFFEPGDQFKPHVIEVLNDNPQPLRIELGKP